MITYFRDFVNNTVENVTGAPKSGAIDNGCSWKFGKY